MRGRQGEGVRPPAKDNLEQEFQYGIDDDDEIQML